MANIPAAICRIYGHNFKRHYLINKKLFLDFKKKDEYPSLTISEMIDAERRGYLNVYKVLLQNTIR